MNLSISTSTGAGQDRLATVVRSCGNCASENSWDPFRDAKQMVKSTWSEYESRTVRFGLRTDDLALHGTGGVQAALYTTDSCTPRVSGHRISIKSNITSTMIDHTVSKKSDVLS